MNFTPIHDWRNWLVVRQARLRDSTPVRVAQDTTNGRVHLIYPQDSITSSGPCELQLTPNEAFALGAELMQAAVQMKAATTTETTR